MRIEGFDISNLGAENIVASMVVFEGGAPKKSDYRKFAISRRRAGRRGCHARGCFSAGSRAEGPVEVERYDPSFEAVPDLVVVDGGKGQLGAALAALAEPGSGGRVAGIAGQARGGDLRTLVPGASAARRRPGSAALRRVRDEAHRFALGFHRAKRSASTTVSLLDQLPGVGEKRKRAIVQHFGSPERFLQASREELEAVPGLPGKVARDIHAYVHKTG